MSVFIKNKDEFDDLTPISFPHEIDLSNLIINNSEIFPITNYSEEGTKWIPISVEVKLETGELDILGIDDAGDIYIIESKLSRNEDKKTVRQQVTDYCHALLKLKEQPTGWEKFYDKIKTANKSKEAEPYVFHNKNLEDIIKENLEEEDFERCLKGVENSFDKGMYTLVVAIDRIPKKLRISIDGQNEIDAKHRIPTFALEINEFTTTSNEKIVVTSTYPYDLAEIKRKKSASRGEAKDRESFERRFEKIKLTDDQRRIFNEFRKEIEELANDISYGTGVNPMIYPYFDKAAGGDRSPLSLGSDGNLRIKFEALFDYVNSTDTDQNIKESDIWKEKFSKVPELKKIYDKGNWSRYMKPKDWLPVQKEITKILKEILA